MALLLLVRYLDYNRDKITGGWWQLPHFARSFIAEPRASAKCLPIKLGESENNSCLNEFLPLTDGYLARDLNRGSLQHEEYAQVHWLPPSDFPSLHWDETGIQAWAPADCSFNNQPLICQGIFLREAWGESLKGNLISLRVKYQLPAGMLPPEVGIFSTSQARVEREDSNGWGWFASALHTDPELGDLVFLDAAYQWALGFSEKMPRLAHNRSIYPGVGAWPGVGKVIRLVSFSDGVRVMAEDQIDEVHVVRGYNVGERVETEGGEVSTRYRELILPAYPGSDGWYVGIRSSQNAAVRVLEIEISPGSSTPQIKPVLSLSPLGYDLVMAHFKKGVCAEKSVACVRKLLKRNTRLPLA
jgi:hypothetical protein